MKLFASFSYPLAHLFKLLFKAIIFLIVAAVLVVASFLVFAMLMEFKPDSHTVLPARGNARSEVLNANEVTLLTWNIGYGGLGAEADFFYDGGKMMRPEKNMFEKYLEGITVYLTNPELADFILLQEVDQNARRSYYTDQVEKLCSILNGYTCVFAVNYRVGFVPVPLTSPMGKVTSGLLNFSNIEPLESVRISFPGNYPWPTRLFNLKRCFILQRFTVANGRELVIINTHNSAFDKGDLRKIQLETLRQVALEEYRRGKYVVIGGDWNMNPPGFEEIQYLNGDVKFTLNERIPDGYFPDGWTMAFDPHTPTNRKVDQLYLRGHTPTTTIDFFLLSPNIQLIEVKTEDMAFSVSDHHPVKIKIRFN